MRLLSYRGVVHIEDYKLIEFFQEYRIELHNLKAGPEEKENLVEKMPEKAEELLNVLNHWKLEVKAEEPVLD